MDQKQQTAAGPAASSPPGAEAHRTSGGGRSGLDAPVGAPPAAAHGDTPAQFAKGGAEEVAREARQVKDSAKQAAGETVDQVKDAAQAAAGQVREQAASLVQQVREHGGAMIDQQKGRAVEVLHDCVAATRRAAEKLHQEDDHNLAHYADALAGRLGSLEGYLRQADGSRMVNDVADLARRRPEWVLGGAFVVGLAVSRFLKASRPDGAAYGSYRQGGPGSGGGSPQSFGLRAGRSAPDLSFTSGNIPDQGTAGSPMPPADDIAVLPSVPPIAVAIPPTMSPAMKTAAGSAATTTGETKPPATFGGTQEVR